MFTAEVLQNHVSVGGVQRQEKRVFPFDAVFGPAAKQDEVFAEVEGLVQSVVDGYNVAVLAYGATGAGKTYTMYGSGSEGADFQLLESQKL